MFVIRKFKYLVSGIIISVAIGVTSHLITHDLFDFSLPTFAATSSGSTVNVSNQNIQYAFTRAKQHPEQLLIDQINSAKTSLDIAIYSLTHPDIVKSISDAKKRGVAVRIISDEQQAGGKAQKQALKMLVNAKIPVKIDNHSGLMHLKITIVDQKLVTTGSFNYSKGAATDNDEVLVVLKDENLAKEWTSQFEDMWNDTKKFEDFVVN